MNFSNLKEWTTPRGKVKELAINGKIAWKYHTHSYTAKVTAPTCTAQGYTTYTCSCGDSYKSDYKAAGHKYGTAYWSSEFSTGYGQKCSVCGHIKAVTPKLSNLGVGSSVFMNVDGVQTEFLVVHQGIPDTTMYDASCNGTWLLMKDIYARYTFDITNHDYENSGIHGDARNFVNNCLDEGVKNIVKQVKLPYTKGVGSSSTLETGSNGISTTGFLLSTTEVGGTSTVMYTEGATLSYFNNATNSKRIATYNGKAQYWWLRTPLPTRNKYAGCVGDTGTINSIKIDNYNGFRPAFILPSSTVIDGTLISKT